MTDLVATEIQRRHVAAPLARAVVDAEAGTFSGYAAVFNDLVPSYNERVLPGAFTRTLSERATRGDALAILWAHDPREVIGVATSLVEDSYGLKVEGRLILDISRARDAHTLIREGINSLSIGFYPVKWDRNAKGEYLIEDAELVEFSVVYAGASPRAKITSIRSLEDSMPTNDTNTAELETRVAELQSRIDELEVRDQRGGTGRTDQTADVEMRALAMFARSGDDTEMRAAASDNGPDGGWFVLPQVDTTIRELVTDISPMRGLAEVVTISTDKYERFYSKGKRGAQWVTERGDRPQDTTRPELIKHSYGVAEMYAAPAATRHVLDDAAVDIAAWLINNATHDFAETEGEAFLDGDGIDNSPKGLLTYPTAPEKDFVRAWGSYGYVPAGHASAPTDANLTTALIKLVAALRKPYKSGAKFLMNSNTAVRLRTIVDGNGRALWAPTGNLIEGVEHPLLGYPVEIDEGMPDIGANAHPIAFGDFRQGYVVVDRQGVRINRDELTQKGRVIFDTYKRVGGGAGDFNAIKFMKVAVS